MKTDLTETADVTAYVTAHSIPTWLKKGLHGLVGLLQQVFQSKIAIVVDGETSISRGVSNTAFTLFDSLKKVGITKGIRFNQWNVPDEPFQFTVDISPSGYGHDFFDIEKSFHRAIGEAVERHAWFRSDAYYKDTRIRASYRTLGSAHALDIFALAGFTEAQKQQYSELQFNEDTIFSWVPAQSLVTGRKIYCPVSLISDRYDRTSGEPKLRWSITTGHAAHTSLKKAQTKAMLEVIERDAFMISYLNKLTPPKINLDELQVTNERIRHIREKLSFHRLDAHVLTLPTDFPVQVLLAILVDQTDVGPKISLGAACDFDIDEGIEHALSEAVACRHYTRSIADQSFNPDNLDRDGRLLFWSKVENTDKLNFFLHANTNATYEPKKEQSTLDTQYQTLVDSFAQKNYEVCCVETSSEETRRLGLRSAAIVVPEMQPLHLMERIPYFGGKRLAEVPSTLGYKAAPSINTVPHPFP